MDRLGQRGVVHHQPLPARIAGRAFAVHEALTAGVGPDRLRSSDLTAPFHGTRLAAGPVAFEDRVAALATRFRPGDAFSGPTAARLWGMPLPPHLEHGPLHVASAPPLAAMRRRGVVGSRLDAGRLRLRGEVTVLSPFDTWLSLAGGMALADLVAIGDYLVTTDPRHAALLGIAELRAALAAAKGREGMPDARRASRLVRVGAWSRPETHLRLLVAQAGLPEPQLNVPIPGSDRRPDLSWSEFRVAVEYNGGHHDDDGQVQLDLRRAEEIALLGWTTVNVDRFDLYRRPADVVGRIRSRLRGRGWS